MFQFSLGESIHLWSLSSSRYSQECIIICAIIESLFNQNHLLFLRENPDGITKQTPQLPARASPSKTAKNWANHHTSIATNHLCWRWRRPTYKLLELQPQESTDEPLQEQNLKFKRSQWILWTTVILITVIVIIAILRRVDHIANCPWNSVNSTVEFPPAFPQK